MDFNSKIAKSKSPEELKDHAITFKENLKVGVKTLADTLRDYRIETRYKSIKSLIGLKPMLMTAGAIFDSIHPLFTNPIMVTAKLAGITAAAGIEMKTSYIEVKNKSLAKTRDSAFSYLLGASNEGIIIKPG